MVRNRILAGNEKGFTLVELLIVVAIIGVLSTIGVPTFRRMIQKAKKSEAKVNLGGLYTSESAFFSEFNGYGNNLRGIGFQIDGANANLTYTVGFLDAGCAPQATAAADVEPLQTSTVGANIDTQFNNYYVDILSVAGRVSRSTAVPDDPATPLVDESAAAAGSGCYTAGDAVVGVTANASLFTAVASGVIAPGEPRDTPTSGEASDVWTIDQGRTLRNVNDGVR